VAAHADRDWVRQAAPSWATGEDSLWRWSWAVGGFSVTDL
jgi:hypothetical protein